MSYLDKKLTAMFNKINSFQDVCFAVKNIKTENIEKHVIQTHEQYVKYHKLPNITDIRKYGQIDKLVKNAYTLSRIYEGLAIALHGFRYSYNEATKQAYELSQHYAMRGNVLSTIRYIIKENFSNEQLQMFIREEIRHSEHEMVLHHRCESTVSRIKGELTHIKGVIEIMNSELTEDTKAYYNTITNKVEQYLKQVA